jgi:hypothetical protein
MIPYGHRLKIMKKIKEFNKLKTTNFSFYSSKEEKPVSKNQYDELPLEELENLGMNDNFSKTNKKIEESYFSKVSKKKENKIIDEEEYNKRLFHMAVIDFVNENRPRFDDNGEEIKYLNEEYGIKPKNKYVKKIIII